METSLLLAQIIGPLFIIVGIGMLINGNGFSKTLLEIVENKALSWVMSFFMIILGSIIITIHNTRNPDWTTIITVLGWIVLIKGAIIMLFPNFMLNISKFFLTKCKNIFYIAGVLRIGLGAYLCNIAFFS